MSKIGQVTVKPSSRKDPCGICGRKAIVNAILCKSLEIGYMEDAQRLK